MLQDLTEFSTSSIDFAGIRLMLGGNGTLPLRQIISIQFSAIECHSPIYHLLHLLLHLLFLPPPHHHSLHLFASIHQSASSVVQDSDLALPASKHHFIGDCLVRFQHKPRISPPSIHSKTPRPIVYKSLPACPTFESSLK